MNEKINKFESKSALIKAFSGKNYMSFLSEKAETDQNHTMDAFSNKWSVINYDNKNYAKELELQKKWYLELYGFETEIEIVRYLDKCDIILDAGAGSANKASWFASLSPNTTVVAVDISTSLIKASQVYSDIPNLFFIRADLANLDFISDNFFDYVSCDQVIHHTAIPRNTFSELVRVTKKDKDLSCYVYRKKALPRELIDDHFRSLSKNLSHEEIMDLSKRLTSLGKKLSQFDGEIDFEAIPQLGIEGGRMTIQRYLYWNFIKCFWDPIRGEEYSTIINYDWYAPSLASRYNEDEYKRWINEEELKIIYFHREPACYSGRFRKTRD